MKLCLICSSGGHLFQLYGLQHLWRKYERFWVTFSQVDEKSLLSGERRYYAYSPTNRNIKNLIRNTYLAIKILCREKPDVIISTGAGIAIPFFYIGKLMKKKLIYIETLSSTDHIALTGRVVLPVADEFIVQWPELKERYPKTRYIGQIL